MNTDKNQEKWINLVHENLKLRGRSEVTFINYKSALKRFLISMIVQFILKS